MEYIVKVESIEVMILDCYCMTRDKNGNRTVVGCCFLKIVIIIMIRFNSE